jgi:hypothetical protein
MSRGGAVPTASCGTTAQRTVIRSTSSACGSQRGHIRRRWSATVQGHSAQRGIPVTRSSGMTILHCMHRTAPLIRTHSTSTARGRASARTRTCCCYEVHVHAAGLNSLRDHHRVTPTQPFCSRQGPTVIVRRATASTTPLARPRPRVGLVAQGSGSCPLGDSRQPPRGTTPDAGGRGVSAREVRTARSRREHVHHNDAASAGT